MEKIGKYVIEKKLGQGGMGIVYKCRDPQTDRITAIKVLPRQLTADPAFLQRFRREINTLERLDHPNIVHVYEQGEEEGAYFYAMEYADGVSLESILQTKEKMPPLRAVNIIRACAKALEHSHVKGIIHRDIKPANIMLTKDDGVKLMDFGIAKVLDATRMTATMGVLGTVEYMSPEQSQGRHVDARSDLYSLGVVLYQCLTARLPITGSTPTEIIMKLKTHQIDPPGAWVPELPKSLDALTMRLLERETSKRVESAQELIRELDRVDQQIKSGMGDHKAADDENIISGGQRTGGNWLNPWSVGFALVAVGFGAWLLFKHPATPEPEPDTAAATPASIMMFNWAKRAHAAGRLDLAEDYCRLIIRNFPDSASAEAAAEELQRIADQRASQTVAPAPVSK